MTATGKDPRRRLGEGLDEAERLYLKNHNKELDELSSSLVEAFPQSREAWEFLAYARNAMKDPSGSLAAYQRAIDIAPEDFEFYDRRDIFLSSEYKQDDRITRMVENWEQYLTRHPEDADVWLLLARLYVAKRRYDAVAEAAQRILALEPGNRKAEILLARAEARSARQG
ncbi:MAG: tetratricopeptide repeat protein [Euryarchaeota archaeon]|nr:tetratricopeptide repeat protein [Euryarchaeota archaeon]